MLSCTLDCDSLTPVAGVAGRSNLKRSSSSSNWFSRQFGPAAMLSSFESELMSSLFSNRFSHFRFAVGALSDELSLGV